MPCLFLSSPFFLPETQQPINKHFFLSFYFFLDFFVLFLDYQALEVQEGVLNDQISQLQSTNELVQTDLNQSKERASSLQEQVLSFLSFLSFLFYFIISIILFFFLINKNLDSWTNTGQLRDKPFNIQLKPQRKGVAVIFNHHNSKNLRFSSLSSLLSFALVLGSKLFSRKNRVNKQLLLVSISSFSSFLSLSLVFSRFLFFYFLFFYFLWRCQEGEEITSVIL